MDAKYFALLENSKARLLASYNDCALERDKNSIAAPSLYAVQKWLRNEHNIHLVIHKDRIDDGLFMDMRFLQLNSQYFLCIQDLTLMKKHLAQE